MNFAGDTVTFTGKGYVLVRWQIVTTEGRVSSLVMPTWTGLKGKLFHVASGGGKRMDDVMADGTSGLGSPATGFDTLPSGAQHMWQNE
jgi:hypothetical protein